MERKLRHPGRSIFCFFINAANLFDKVLIITM